jgi:hypothetical protein
MSGGHRRLDKLTWKQRTSRQVCTHSMYKMFITVRGCDVKHIEAVSSNIQPSKSRNMHHERAPLLTDTRLGREIIPCSVAVGGVKHLCT